MGRSLSAVVAVLGVFLLLPATGHGQAPPASTSEWEYRAVTFGKDEDEATRKLNRLAADGWEYVGPLGMGLVSFRRRAAGEDSATEIRRLENHNDNVSMAAFSPAGDTLVSTSEDGTVVVCDWKTGKVLKTLEGHTGGVLHAAFAPDGKTLATSSRDKTVILWDVAVGTKTATLDDHTATVSAALFSPDGKTLATASDDSSVILREPGGKFRLRLEGHKQPAIALAYSPDGKTLVSGGGDWNSADRAGEVIAWDLATGKQRWSVGDLGGVWGLAFSPDGTALAGACLDGTVRVWEPATGKETAVLRGHSDRVIWVAYTPSGLTLASSSSDGTVRLWDAKTGREKAVLKGHMGPVQRLAFSPDGKVLATTGNDRTVRIWQLGK